MRTRLAHLLPPIVGKPRDWNRRTYSEKLRWRCRHPDPRIDYATWADKNEAKRLVQESLPSAETYAVVRHPDAIPALALPPTFVMKATHGWNMSLLVQDRVMQGGNRTREGQGLRADPESLRRVAREWLGSEDELKRQAEERHYALVRQGILFEEYLDTIDHEVQLFLFGGRLGMAMVFFRGFRHDGTTHRLFDAEWNLLEPGLAEFATVYERCAPPTPRPPRSLLDSLEAICRRVDHVRVDLYACGDRYVFGEFTFTHAAGDAGYIGKYDAELGRCWPR